MFSDGERRGVYTGVLQVNVKIPITATGGRNELLLELGDRLSRRGVTIFVR